MKTEPKSAGPMSSGASGVPAPRVSREGVRESREALDDFVALLPSPAVVVGPDGRVRAANRHWTELAELRGGSTVAAGVGADYLGACRAGANDAQADKAARRQAGDAGQLIRDVLAGRRSRGHLYYDCPPGPSSPNAEEWLLVVETIVPPGADVPFALVTHHPPEVLAGQIDPRARDGLMLRRLSESGYDLTWVADASGTVQWVSAGVTPMLGWGPEDLVGQAMLPFLHPDDAPLVAMRLAVDTTTAGRHAPVRFRFRHRDDCYRWLEATPTNLLDDPVVGGIVVNARDITAAVEAEQRLAEHERRQHSILESLSEAVVVADEQGVITQVNAAAVALFGYPDESAMVGLPTERLMPPDLALRHQKAMRRYTESGETALALRRDLPLLALRRDGSTTPVELTLGEVRTTTGRVFTATIRDVSERLAVHRRLEEAALKDPLTTIGNRRLVTSCLEQGLARLDDDVQAVALVYVDLDDFTAVNDVRGEHVGDQVLVALAARLETLTRSVGDGLRAVAGRLGGDDFVLVVEVVDGAGSLHACLEPLLTALHRQLEQAVLVDGDEVVLHAAIGIAVSDDAASSADVLLRGAQVAMRHARAEGGVTPRFYDEALRRQERRKVADLAALRQALGRGELALHYQAISRVVPGDSGVEPYAAEALLRWARPGHGLVPPAEFVPLLETSGLILEVGTWVLQQAVADAARWGSTQWPMGVPASVSVNVSPRQLTSVGFVSVVQEALEASGLPPQRLILEVTEELALTPRAVRVLGMLRQFGVRVAIDDFGTGHSSLAYLSSLPADILKLDRGFVARVPGSRVDVAVIEAVADLARALGLCVVAEGVETSEQLACLAAAGISRIQGFLLDRPHPLP